MAVTVCPFCAGEVPEGTATCPHCGHALGPPREPQGEGRRPLVGGLGCGMLAVLLVLVSLVLLFGLLAGGLLG